MRRLSAARQRKQIREHILTADVEGGELSVKEAPDQEEDLFQGAVLLVMLHILIQGNISLQLPAVIRGQFFIHDLRNDGKAFGVAFQIKEDLPDLGEVFFFAAPLFHFYTDGVFFVLPVKI